ncbi:MAG: hypothetical protein GF347_03985 [Candidatus Moranbacteria bacterium]|nr:hypothetical protein [Candidatus Moranbacteria bacterium]
MTRGELIGLPPGELLDYLKDLKKNEKLDAFLEEVGKHEDLTAFLNDWLKWSEKEVDKRFGELIEEKRKIYRGAREVSSELPFGLENVCEAERALLIRNATSLELDFGCPHGCPLCGLDASKGVRKSVTYEELCELLSLYGEKMQGDVSLFYASDPVSWEDKICEKNILDVIQLFERSVPSFKGRCLITRSVDDKHIPIIRKLPRVVLSGNYISKKKERELSRETGRMFDPGRHFPIGYYAYKMFSRDNRKKYRKLGEQKIVLERCGVLLSPRGRFNVVRMREGKITKEIPRGHLTVPIGKIYDEEQIHNGMKLENVLNHSILKAEDLDPLSIEEPERFEKSGIERKSVPYITVICKKSDKSGEYQEVSLLVNREHKIRKLSEREKKELDYYFDLERDRLFSKGLSGMHYNQKVLKKKKRFLNELELVKKALAYFRERNVEDFLGLESEKIIDKVNSFIENRKLEDLESGDSLEELGDEVHMVGLVISFYGRNKLDEVSNRLFDEMD